MKVEEDDRTKKRENDGYGGGKAFKDVVRVLDDDRSDKAAEHLDGHRGPSPTTKVAEEVADDSI